MKQGRHQNMDDHTLIQQLVDSDSLLRDSVLEAIEADSVLRESKVPLEVGVQDGVVTVSGHVMTETMRQRAVYAASTMPGVKKVIDAIGVDTEIASTIARDLARDPALKDMWIEVSSHKGIVTLYGDVDSKEQRAAALAQAQATAGVHQVVDRLTVTAAE
jgi:osmotically-inducible protein OsmY